MNVLNHEQIAKLIQHRAPLSVSVFMPTNRAGRERRQDPIRFKNLVSKAREWLLHESDSTSKVDEILEPAVELRSDTLFWRHCSDGLACFCAPGTFEAYRVPLNLDEQVFVNDRYYVRPLLPLLRAGVRFYILALTQETAKLFEATRYSIREIPLPEVVRLNLEDDERPHQYHSHRAPTQGKGSTETAIYHGQGGPADRVKKDALRFF